MIATVCRAAPKASPSGAKTGAYGKDVGGLLRYLYGPGKANEHVNPRVVGSWDGDNAAHQPEKNLSRDGSYGHSTRELARELSYPVTTDEHLFGDGYVYHVAVSLKGAADGVLSDEQWGEIAADLMHRVGISTVGDEASGCRWVAVHHGPSASGNDHIHIVATLARMDGKRPRIWGDYQALRTGAQEWEQRLGLTVTADIDGTASKTAQRGEQAKEAREGREVPVREQLSRAVRDAAGGAANESEFFAALRNQGLAVKLRHHGQTGEVIGYSVGLAGHTTASGEQIYFSGSTLDRQSLPRLQRGWALSPDLSALGVDADDAYSAAAEAAQEATEALRDPDTLDSFAAGIAWTAGDTAAAWAAHDEAGAAGPRTELADKLARAGRPTTGTEPVSGSASAGLRIAARMLYITRGTMGSDLERQTAQLTAVMLELAAATAQWRESQGKPVQAAVARDASQMPTAAFTAGSTPAAAQPAQEKTTAKTHFDGAPIDDWTSTHSTNEQGRSR